MTENGKPTSAVEDYEIRFVQPESVDEDEIRRWYQVFVSGCHTGRRVPALYDRERPDVIYVLGDAAMVRGALRAGLPIDSIVRRVPVDRRLLNSFLSEADGERRAETVEDAARVTNRSDLADLSRFLWNKVILG